MKKYFSLALFMVMVLTFVGTVPAMATETGDNSENSVIELNDAVAEQEFGENLPLDSSYPFVSLDFNESSDVTFASKSEDFKISWSENGVGNVGGAVHFDRSRLKEANVNMGTISDLHALDTYDYRVSCWVRVDKEITVKDLFGDGFGFVMWAPYADNKTGYHFISKSNGNGFSSGNWVYIEMKLDQAVWQNKLNSGGAIFNPESKGNAYFAPRIISVSDNDMSAMLTGYVSGDRFGWYLDDFRVDPIIPADATDVPVVSDVVLTSSDRIGREATLTYNYTPTDDATDSKVVVRVSKEVSAGKYTTIDQFFAPLNGCSYTIPESALNAKLKYEIIPYDKTEKMHVPGTIQSVVTANTMIYEQVISSELFDFVSSTKSISSSVSVDNYKLDESEINLISILAFYDANGALVSCKVKPIVAYNNTSIVYPHNVTFSDGELYEKIASAKMYVWGGSGFADTTRIAYTDVLEVTK